MRAPQPSPEWRPVTGEELVPYELWFMRRVLQDAWIEATAAYWRRRAEQFEAARPRPGDYPGQATGAEAADVDARLAATALACRRRATLADLALAELDETLQALAEGAA